MYRPGEYKVCCPVCGFTVYRSKCRKRWDGVLVCADCWDEKPPQLDTNYTKSINEGAKKEDSRAEPEPVFISDTGEVTWDDL